MKYSIYCLLVGTLLLSCGKEKIDDHPDFIGYWEGGTFSKAYILNVESNGAASYSEVGFASSAYSGRFKLKPDEYVKIGVKKLTLDQYPVDSVDYWVMQLDGIRFYSYR